MLKEKRTLQMKLLFSHEHYSYKTNTLPKISACPPFYRHPYIDYPIFLQENLQTLPFSDLSKLSTLSLKKGNSHYVDMFRKLS